MGEIVEYLPTVNETLVTLGIWAFGLLVYTILVRITVPVLAGRLVVDRPYSPRMGSPARLNPPHDPERSEREPSLA